MVVEVAAAAVVALVVVVFVAVAAAVTIAVVLRCPKVEVRHEGAVVVQRAVPVACTRRTTRLPSARREALGSASAEV